MDIKEKIEKLRRLIEHQNRLYYDNDRSEMSDYEYDELVQELKMLEVEHPEYATLDSPTQKVGGEVIRESKKVQHDVPVISLQDAFSKEKVYNFIDKVSSQINQPKFVVEKKIDGLTLMLRYRNGVLEEAITRGNGEYGDSVIDNALVIKSIPKKISIDLPYLEVRGEVYMSKKSFEEVLLKESEKGGKKYKTPRNLASGTLKQLDTRIVKERNLDIFIFNLEIAEGKKFHFHSEALEWLESLGFPVIPNYKICSTADEVWKVVEEIGLERNYLPFDIDGTVIKLDNLNDRDLLGNTSKVPRWAIAYKYPPEQKETIIKDIQIQVGRTGKLTPLAILEKIKLSGTDVSKATLHNQDFIDLKDIQIGDTVIIQKAGDIIPEVIKSIPEKRPDDSQKYTIPGNCPICNSPTIKDEKSADTRCVNRECAARKLNEIVYFVSKAAMDIEGLGPNSVEALVTEGYIKDVSDIFYIENFKDELISKGVVGRKKATQKLLNAINNAKNNDLNQLITGLGIKNVGKQTARILAENFKNIDEISQATFDQLITLPDFGVTIAKNVVDFFSDNKNQELLLKLKNANVNMESNISVKNLSDDRFSGLTFVITGTLSTLKRDEATNLVQRFGGKVSSSVSKKTSYVLAGEEAGTKLTKAQDLGITIISEDEFMGMIK